MPPHPAFQQTGTTTSSRWWRSAEPRKGAPTPEHPNDMRPKERNRKVIKARRKASAKARHRK